LCLEEKERVADAMPWQGLANLAATSPLSPEMLNLRTNGYGKRLTGLRAGRQLVLILSPSLICGF
jgi:hypothetical protein